MQSGLTTGSRPHAMGSSHGETRITRQAIGECEVYVPLVQRSHEIWRELEHETGWHLLEACCVLIIGAEGGAALHHNRSGFVLNTVAAAEAYGIEHDVLSVEDSRQTSNDRKLRRKSGGLRYDCPQSNSGH
jgi:sarcosine oxidase